MTTSPDPRILDLLDQWEQAREAGRPISLEELCDGKPDLLPAVRAALVLLDGFPTVTGDTGDHPAGRPACPPDTDRYHFASLLGQGGMGDVWLARDRVLDRDVAVKVLAGRLVSPGAVVRFAAEARLAARLQHPGITPVHDSGFLPDGRPFFAMKRVAGETLDESLKGRASPGADWARYLPVVEQVCQAVAFAHASRPAVLHRDLKPQNVMVGAFGEVQVMDWGLARVAGGLGPLDAAGDAEPAVAPASTEVAGGPHDATRPGEVKGTWAYMAPEQARGEGEAIGPATDVFGLGGLLCAVITGRPTYDGPDSEVVARKARAGDLIETHARLAGSGADDNLLAIVRGCLAAAPAARPIDGAAVAALMGGYRVGVEARLRAAEADRAAAEARAVEQRKRRKVQLGLAAAIGLLLVGGAAFGWWQDHQSTERRLEQVRADGRLKAGQAAFAIEMELLTRQRRERIPALLRLSTDLRTAYKFGEAKRAVTEARELAAGAGTADLQVEVEVEAADLALVVELDRIRRGKSAWVAGSDSRHGHDPTPPTQLYRAAFLARGFELADGREAADAARVTASAVRRPVLDAIDVWSVSESDRGRREYLLAVARLADPGPWQDRFRDPAIRADRSALKKLVDDVDPAAASAGTLSCLFTLHFRHDLPLDDLVRRVAARGRTGYELEFVLGLANSRVDVPRAIAHLRAAHAHRPDDHFVLQVLGSLYVVQGDTEAALGAYELALALAPDAPLAREIGLLYRKRSDRKRAIAAFRAAAGAAPAEAEPCFQLAFELEADRNFLEAIAWYEKGTRLDDKNAFLTNLGNCYRAVGRLDEAVAAHRRAVALAKDDPLAWNNLGNALADQKDWAGATAALRKATQLDTKFAVAFCNLGDVLMNADDLTGAVEALTRAVALTPDNMEAARLLARARRLAADRERKGKGGPPVAEPKR